MKKYKDNNMKTEIKTKDNTFIFNIPDYLDKSVSYILNDWCKLVEQDKNVEDDIDVWTTIPQLPKYKFKNLKIINDQSDNATEFTFTYQYDDFEKIQN